jgi:membrane protease subunit (stomatin/prohibitin family)
MLMRRPVARMGRPGVLGTMARTAVVAGTATAVVGGVQRHEQSKAQEQADLADYQAQQQAEAAQQAAAAPAVPVAELERLATLKQQGVLTDAEFTAAKSKLLGLA